MGFGRSSSNRYMNSRRDNRNYSRNRDNRGNRNDREVSPLENGFNQCIRNIAEISIAITKKRVTQTIEYIRDNLNRFQRDLADGQIEDVIREMPELEVPLVFHNLVKILKAYPEIQISFDANKLLERFAQKIQAPNVRRNGYIEDSLLEDLSQLARANWLSAEIKPSYINLLISLLHKIEHRFFQTIACAIRALGTLAVKEKLSNQIDLEEIIGLIRIICNSSPGSAQVMITISGLKNLAKSNKLTKPLSAAIFFDLMEKCNNPSSNAISGMIFDIGLLLSANQLADPVDADKLSRLITSVSDPTSHQLQDIFFTLGLLTENDAIDGVFQVSALSKLPIMMNKLTTKNTSNIAYIISGLGKLAKAGKLDDLVNADELNNLVRCMRNPSESDIMHTLIGLTELVKTNSLSSYLITEQIIALITSINAFDPDNAASVIEILGSLAPRLTHSISVNEINRLIDSINEPMPALRIENIIYGLSNLVETKRLRGRLEAAKLNKLISLSTDLSARVSCMIHGLGVLATNHVVNGKIDVATLIAFTASWSNPELTSVANFICGLAKLAKTGKLFGTVNCVQLENLIAKSISSVLTDMTATTFRDISKLLLGLAQLNECRIEIPICFTDTQINGLTKAVAERYLDPIEASGILYGIAILDLHSDETYRNFFNAVLLHLTAFKVLPDQIQKNLKVSLRKLTLEDQELATALRNRMYPEASNDTYMTLDTDADDAPSHQSEEISAGRLDHRPARPAVAESSPNESISNLSAVSVENRTVAGSGRTTVSVNNSVVISFRRQNSSNSTQDRNLETQNINTHEGHIDINSMSFEQRIYHYIDTTKKRDLKRLLGTWNKNLKSHPQNNSHNNSNNTEDNYISREKNPIEQGIELFLMSDRNNLEELIKKSPGEYFSELLFACSLHYCFQFAINKLLHLILINLDINQLKEKFIVYLVSPLQIYRDSHALTQVINALTIRLAVSNNEEKQLIQALQIELLNRGIEYHSHYYRPNIISRLRMLREAVERDNLRLSNDDMHDNEPAIFIANRQAQARPHSNVEAVSSSDVALQRPRSLEQGSQNARSLRDTAQSVRFSARRETPERSGSPRPTTQSGSKRTAPASNDSPSKRPRLEHATSSLTYFNSGASHRVDATPIPEREALSRGTAQQISLRYKYSEEDINYLLKYRFAKEVGVEILPVTPITRRANVPYAPLSESLHAYLNTTQQTDQTRNIIIPINSGDHWIGLRLIIKKDVVKCALYYNNIKSDESQKHHLQLITNELKNVFSECGFIFNNKYTPYAKQLLQETNPFSVEENNNCGPLLIENMYCDYKSIMRNDISNRNNVTEEDVRKIREHHLNILKAYNPTHYAQMIKEQNESLSVVACRFRR